jgi:hypothetical protein
MARKITLSISLLLLAAAATSCTKHGPVAALAPLPSPPPVAAGHNAEDEDGEANDSPGAALQFFVEQRAPDGRNIPTGRYLAAAQAAKRMRGYSLASARFTGENTKGQAQADLGGGWTNAGPMNLGGLTRAFVIHPNTPSIMYAGASGGGVWKTTDGGATWRPLGDFLPSISVHWLALDPKDPETIYAGTGDNVGATFTIRGAGIFKSSDSGASWSVLPGTANDPNFYVVNRVMVSPNDSSHIYAATTTGVWMSTDGGASFTQTLPRIAPNSGCEDLVMRTDQGTDSLFAACGRFNFPTSAVFRNLDAAGGGSWETVLAPAGMGATSLAIAPSNQSIVYAMMASVDPNNAAFNNGLLAVYRSMANGDKDSWEIRASNSDSNRVNVSLLSNPRSTFNDICTTTLKSTYTGQGGHDNVLAVDPVNPDRVWAGGIDTFRSDDGGATWGIAMFWQASAPIAAHADNHVLAFHPQYDGGKNQTLYNTSDGGVYVTTNANADVATGNRAGCSPYPAKVAWKSLNNGYTVTQFYDGTAFPGGNQYLAGSQDNGTQFSGDGMNGNWLEVYGGDGGFVLVNPKDPNEIYWNYTYLSLFRSLDGGNTYSPVIDGITEPAGNFLFIAPVALDPSEPKRLYIGGHFLWRSNDRGDSWEQASPLLKSTQGSISAIAVSPADPNIAIFGTSGGQLFNTASALTSTNTTTWNSSSPRSSGFVARIAFDPVDPNTAYAVYRTYKLSGQNYVYKTSDGGVSWRAIDGTGDGALPDGPVHSIVVDPVNPQTLYVGTEHGVFTSLDNGNNWLRDDNPFGNSPVTQLVMDYTAGVRTLVAFTFGRGVWKTVLPGSGAVCQYSLPTKSITLHAAGVPQSVAVQAGDGCVWPVVPLSGWVYAQSPAIGYGNGSATIYGDWNTFGLRTARVLVGTSILTVTQNPGTFVFGNDSTAFKVSDLPFLGFVDTRLFTADAAADPVHSCTGSADYKSAWWSYTATASGTLQIAAMGQRFDVGGNSGVVLTAYGGGSRSADAELGCVVQPRDSAAWARTKTIEISVTAGKTYLIEASATGGTANDGGFVIVSLVMK